MAPPPPPLSLRGHRLLNGSNSRVYRLTLSNGDPFIVIGTETGLLSAPVSRDTLTITPGNGSTWWWISRLTPRTPETAVYGRVAMHVYDVAGRKVRSLVDQDLPAGRYTATWDGRDAGGAAVRAGVYWVRLAVGGEELSRKMVHVR